MFVLAFTAFTGPPTKSTSSAKTTPTAILSGTPRIQFLLPTTTKAPWATYSPEGPVFLSGLLDEDFVADRVFARYNEETIAGGEPAELLKPLLPLNFTFDQLL